MTDHPQGRDATPSVAALAIHFSSLRRDLGTLAAKVSQLAAAQHADGAVMEDIAELRRQVEQILALLATDDDSPAEWFWLTMSEQERQERLSELADWVETVLRRQYPDYLANRLKPCWPRHPEARWELAWLYHLWSHAYLATRPAPKDAADWHDRWAPGVIRRLTDVMRRCDNTCQHQRARPAINETPR